MHSKEISQRGFGFLHVFAILIVVISLAIGFKVYKSNQKKAELAHQVQLRKQEAERKAALIRELTISKEKISSLLQKWEDAVRLASMTSRIALAQPLSQMQATRREVSELKINECFNKATKEIATGMDDAIFAFEMFIRFPSNYSASDTTSKYLISSKEKVSSASKSLDACIPVQ